MKGGRKYAILNWKSEYCQKCQFTKKIQRLNFWEKKLFSEETPIFFYFVFLKTHFYKTGKFWLKLHFNRHRKILTKNPSFLSPKITYECSSFVVAHLNSNLFILAHVSVCVRRRACYRCLWTGTFKNIHVMFANSNTIRDYKWELFLFWPPASCSIWHTNIVYCGILKRCLKISRYKSK